MTALTVPKTSLDLQILLQERLDMQPKEFEQQFDVEETEDKLVLRVHRDSTGKFVWLETHLWTVTNDYMREVGGSYFKPERKWEIPLKDGNSTPSSTPIDTPIDIPKEVKPYEGMRSRIEKKIEGPIKLDAHERMGNNLKNINKIGKQLSSNILTTNIRLAELELGVFSPRKQFSPEYVNELAESIKNEGQLKPIIVRLHPTKENVYQVIDGETRIRAFQKLGHNLIRAEIRQLDDQEADVFAMTVNEMHGKRLNALEEGLHLEKLMQTYGWSQEQVGKNFNRSQDWVSQRLRIARDSSKALIDSFTTRVVNVGTAREIAKLDKENQPEVVKKVVEEKLPARKTKALVDALKIADSPIERKLVLEKIPKLPVKKAEALTDSLRDKPSKERIAILEKPLETFAEIFKTPESFEKGASAPEQKAVAETFTCTCGKKFFINWFEQTIQGAD